MQAKEVHSQSSGWASLHHMVKYLKNLQQGKDGTQKDTTQLAPRKHLVEQRD